MYFDDYNYKFFNKFILPSPEEIREIIEYENRSRTSSKSSMHEDENFSLKEIDEILKSQDIDWFKELDQMKSSAIGHWNLFDLTEIGQDLDKDEWKASMLKWKSSIMFGDD